MCEAEKGNLIGNIRQAILKVTTYEKLVTLKKNLWNIKNTLHWNAKAFFNICILPCFNV